MIAEQLASDPAEVMFRLSGPVRVERRGAAFEIGPTSVRTLMAVLLLERGRYVDREKLIDYMWDVPPRSAGTNLRGFVSDLRRQLSAIEGGLESRLTTLRGHRGGYSLEVEDDLVDVATFTRLANKGIESLRSDNFDTATDFFGRALLLWSGPIGQGCSGSAALGARFAALDDLNITVRERLATAQMMLGRSAELLPELNTLVTVAPHRETSWGLLMRASYLAGDIVGAVQTWKRATATLADELGLEPSPDMSDLYLAVLRRDDDAVRQREQ
jgi:SARP family transcriptional regulator, regulator of embCAB operon